MIFYGVKRINKVNSSIFLLIKSVVYNIQIKSG